MTDTFVVPAPSVVRASPFSAEIPHFQIAWDSTSLGLLKECPRKYYYEIILGWRPAQQSVHLIFGQLYHAAMEHYDHFAASIGKLSGGLTDAEHNEGIRRALRHCLTASGRYTALECVACEGAGTVKVSDDAPRETCEVCEGKGTFGPATWEPWRSTDPYKNLWTLCRSVVYYLDTFRDSKLSTVLLQNGKPAVELSFAYEAGDVDGISYLFCGHIDRVVEDREAAGRKSGHDRKTTKGQLNAGYWKSFNPHGQFSHYTAALTLHYDQPTWGITVDAAQVLVNSTTFARQFIPFPPALIDEYLAETKVWITLAARFAQAGHWPRNDKSCGSYGGCPFRDVCSKSPAFRQSWLEAGFVFNRWNPLEVRGDI